MWSYVCVCAVCHCHVTQFHDFIISQALEIKFIFYKNVTVLFVFRSVCVCVYTAYLDLFIHLG